MTKKSLQQYQPMGHVGVERRSRVPLELSAESDLLYDYILKPYEPRAEQVGKLRSVTVLQETFALAGVDREGAALVAQIRRRLGEFRTVWGVKLDASGSLRGWELYFYDWTRVHADLSVSNLVEILEPCVNVDAREARPLPWHMVSVEFSADDLRNRGTVPLRVYIDMRSYELRGEQLRFENIYTFHDPRREIDDVLHRLRASVYLDVQRENLAEFIPPALFRCEKMCVANKREGDGLYFSRVDTDAFVGFLRARNYPAELVAWVDAEKRRLNHLLWDVGIDFTRVGQRAVIRKSGFYGSF